MKLYFDMFELVAQWNFRCATSGTQNFYFEGERPLFLHCFVALLIDDRKKDEREREGMTCSKEPQVGLDTWAAAARTQPLYMGRLLY